MGLELSFYKLVSIVALLLFFRFNASISSLLSWSPLLNCCCLSVRLFYRRGIKWARDSCALFPFVVLFTVFRSSEVNVVFLEGSARLVLIVAILKLRSDSCYCSPLFLTAYWSLDYSSEGYEFVLFYLFLVDWGAFFEIRTFCIGIYRSELFAAARIISCFAYVRIWLWVDW